MPKILENDAVRLVHGLDQMTDEQRAASLDIIKRYKQQQDDEGEPFWPSVERARVEQENSLRRMFEAPDKIDYDPGYTSADPLHDKMQHANMALLSARYQKEPAEVASRYDFLINDYARQKLGASEDVDTAKFYALAQKDMQKVKLREDTQREGMSAALRGEDGVKALAAWQAKNADRAKDDAGLFMRGYQQAIEQDGEMLPIADRLLKALESGTDKTGQNVQANMERGQVRQELGQMVEQLAGMKKAQRKSVYRSIAARIEAAGYDQKGFWSQMLGYLDQQLYRAETTLSETGGIASDVASNFPAMLAEGMTGNRDFGMTAAETEQTDANVARRKSIGNVQQEIMQIVSGELDPVKPVTGWMNETIETGLIKGPGAVAPFMAASALLGPYGAGFVFTADFAAQNRRELVQSGLDDEQAQKIAVMAAPLQAAVESLSNMVSLGKFPAVQEVLSRFTRPVGGASLVGRYVQNSLISGATEFTEEQVQDNVVVPAMQELLGALEKDVPEVDWSFYKTRAANATPELAATLLPMALVFGGVMTAADARLSDRMTSNVDALTALNYSQAQATEIVQEKTPEARIAKAASLWRSRAGNKATLEEGAAKLAERLKALSGDAVAYQAELERRGVLPRVMHTAENDWLLTFNDGSTARFATHDEASTARWTWAEDQLGRVHALTREALTSMERNMSTNRELGVEFKPDVRMVEAGQTTPDIQRRVEQGKVLGDIDPNEAFDTASMVDRATAEADGFLSSYQILGSSRNEFKDGVLRTTIKLWEGSNVLTLVEEKLEGDAKAIVASRGGRGWMLAALRNYEQESGDKLFREVPDDQLTDDDLVEAWSHLGQSYLVGRSSFGEPLQQNNMRRFSRLLMRAGLAGALNSESTFWQAVVNRAQKLGELKAAGKLGEDVVAELEKQLGIDSQVKHEQESLPVIQQVANEVAQQVDTSGYSEANPGPNGETFSASRAIPADASKVVQMPDGARLVGPTTFSIAEYAGNHRPNNEGPRAFDLLEGGISPADVYQHPEWYSAMEPKVIRETMAQLRKVKGNPKAKLTIYRAGPKGEMNTGDWVSLSKEYARTHAESQDPEGFRVWQAQVAADSVRWSLDDLAEFGYFGEQIAASDTGETFSIRAFHGTPHKVDKFSLSKIGTGEGAQAYGWGLYFAENQGVAKSYQKNLTGVDSFIDLKSGDLIGQWDSRFKEVSSLRERLLSAGDKAEFDRLYETRMDGGNLYTVELLPDKSEFLDWDKPLSEQSEKVKAALSAFSPSMTGADIYADVTRKNRAVRMERGVEIYDIAFAEKQASKFLQSRKIPGIRYADGQSRVSPLEIRARKAEVSARKADAEASPSEANQNALRYAEQALADLIRKDQEGTRNYVIFDENLVRILEENGTPVAQEPEQEPEPGELAPDSPVEDLPLEGDDIQWTEETFSIAPRVLPEVFPAFNEQIKNEIAAQTKTIAAIHIDRMKVGEFAGVPLQGGFFYPAIVDNLKKGVVWAFNADNIARGVANRAAANGGFIKLVLMQEGNVVGNKTFGTIWFKLLDEAIAAKRISKTAALTELNRVRAKFATHPDSNLRTDHVKTWKSVDEARNAIIGMPQKKRGATYFQKSKTVTKSQGVKIAYQSLLSQAMTEMGFPDAAAIVESIEEPSFKGVPTGAVVGIIKIDPLSESQKVMTATEAGVPEHLSYKYVLHGKPVARMTKFKVIDETFPETKNKLLSQQHTNFPLEAAFAETFSLRVTPAQDAEYMAAVEAGDMEKAQRMVDEAAKAAGFAAKLFHGTTATEDVLVRGKGPKESAAEAEKGLRQIAEKYGVSEWRYTDAYPRMLAVNYMGITQQEVDAALKLKRAYLDAMEDATPDTNEKRIAFNVFNMPSGEQEFGVHVGNEGAAAMFGEVFPFWVRLGKQVRLPDLGTWGYQAVIQELRKKGVRISDAEYDLVFNSSDPNSVLRQILRDKGFESIVYRNEAEGEGDSYILTAPSQIKSADPVTRDEAGNVIPLSQRFNPADDRITYSLRPGDFASRVEAMFSPFQRSPEARLVMARVAKDRALRLGNELIEKANVIRTMGSIDREARVRAALAEDKAVQDYLDGLTPAARQTLEWQPADLQDDPLVAAMLDFGKLMSKTTALQRGKLDLKMGDFDGAPWLPPSFYSKGAGIMPDQMAQAMFDAGLLPDAYTDTLWSELSKRIEAARKDKAAHREAVQAFQDAKKAARDAAAKEAGTWADNAKKQAGSGKAQRDRIKAWLRVLDGILAASPPDVRARVGGFTKMAGIATDEAALRYLEDRVAKLDKELEKWLKKDATGSINRLFKRAAADYTAGKKAKGKLGPDEHYLFQRAEAASEMDAAALRGQLANLDVLADDESLSDDQRALAVLERGIAELVGDMKNADSGRLFTAFDELSRLYSQGVVAWKAKQAARREARQAVRDALKADAGKSGVLKERQAMEKAMTTLFGKAKSAWLSVSSFSEVLRYAFGSKSQQATELIDGEREASNAYEDEQQAIADELEAFFASMAGGKTLDGERLRFDMAQRTIKAGDVELSQFEAVTALLMWRQEDGRRHMEGTFDENGQRTSGWSYDQAWIDEVEKQLTPEGRRFMAWLAAKYGSEHGELNALYRERHGVNLPAHDNYAPITVKPMQAKAGEIVDPVSGAAVSGSILTPGSLRTRSRMAIAEPEFRDALQTFVAHKKQMGYWKAYYDLATDVQAVLGNRELMNSVEAAAGAEAVIVLGKWMTVLAQGGVRDAAAGLAMNGIFQRMMNRAATVGLLGRVSTLLVQSTQLAAASVQMPVGAYLRRFGKLLAGQLDWKGAIQSDFIQRRIQSAPPIVRQAMENLGTATRPNLITRAVRNLGNLLSGADGLFTGGTYAILLDYHRETGRKLGLTGADLEEHAHREAERATEQVAQPTRTATRSLAELTATNPLAKVSFAYASEARQKIALLGWAAVNFKADPVRFGKAAFLVFGVGGVISQVLKNIWKEAKGDDDEEKWSPERLIKGSFVNALHGIPMMAELMGEPGMFSSTAWAQASLDDLLKGEADMRDINTLLGTVGLFNDTAAGVAALSNAGYDFAKIIEAAFSDASSK